MNKRLIISVIFLFAIASMAFSQKMTVKDSDLNVLMEVNDEGAVGSIMLPQGSTPGVTTNKLYNVGGSLYWNGSALGLAGSAGGWTDDGTVVRLTTSTDKVGIGDDTPTNKLDVAGKIGINDTTVLFLPDQMNFTGTLIIGNGGSSLSHSSGDQGWYNTAIGIGALNANNIGKENTASGYQALHSNKSGYHNTASGCQALRLNDTGCDNTASGWGALDGNTTGNYNTASGGVALYSNTTGSNNTASGYEALYSNNGNNNTAFGAGANRYNEFGSNNTMIGFEAGSGTSIHNKSGNIFIGYQAGYNETGSNKLYIENSNSSSPLIGGDFSADEIYLNGNVGIGTTSPGEKLEVNGTSLFSGNMRINGKVGLNADPLTSSQNTLYLYDGAIFSEPRIEISGHNQAMLILDSRRESTTDGNRWIVQSGGGTETYLDQFAIGNSDDGGCFYIRDGGKVGIGEKWVKNRLDVEGAIAVGSTYSGTNTAPSNGMIIEGNVGIGKTSPDSELDVNGEIRSTYGFFHDRGDASAHDKIVSDWTKDGNWYDWDLSSVVPEGTKGIVIRGYIKSGVAGEYFLLRENGNSNEYNVLQCETQVAGIAIHFQGVVPCDGNRIIEYKFQNSVNWTDAAAVVVGWIK